MSTHADFCAALRAPSFACPPGLTTWNGSDPARRFAVYRNNVLVSLIDALADSYPVVQALVGEAFFRAMAGEFVRHAPPCSPILAVYGEDFAAFVESFPPAAGLPYLGDVARLEYAYVLAYHAADAAALPAGRIAALLADETALPRTRFALHPALQVLSSPHAVVSLWAAHQDAGDLAAIDLAAAESAVVLRQGLEVAVLRVTAGTAEFIAALARGDALGPAAETALARHADFDLAAALGLMIRSDALVGILSTEN